MLFSLKAYILLDTGLAIYLLGIENIDRRGAPWNFKTDS